MPRRNDPVTGVLIDARKLIEQGWVKGTYERDGRYCMIGALSTVVWGNPCPYRPVWAGRLPDPYHPDYPTLQVYNAARERLEDVVGQPIGGWNDLWSRTKDEVLEAFRKAIEIG